MKKVIPAQKYLVSDFIKAGNSDDMTYRNFSIIEKINDQEFIDHNIVDDYFDELKSLSREVTLSREEIVKYRFAPDLLAFDIYGSTQLDFVVMLLNDMVDPKDFSLSSGKLILPMKSVLMAFLSMVYNAEKEYFKENRKTNQ